MVELSKDFRQVKRIAITRPSTASCSGESRTMEKCSSFHELISFPKAENLVSDPGSLPARRRLVLNESKVSAGLRSLVYVSSL
jgi:hypothetical protein